MTTPAPLTFGSLFSGIGGFDLGMERAGLVCKWQVEIHPFCTRVLAKHWPHVPRFGDVKNVGKHNLEPTDVIVGGFPCQPHSLAGKRKGAADDRDLWPEYRRVIAELRPAWVIGENVPGIIGVFLDSLLSDLESLTYETATFVIPACAVDAPHRRDRVFIVAYTDRQQAHEQCVRPGESSRQPGQPLETREEATRQAHGETSNNDIARLREVLADANGNDKHGGAGNVQMGRFGSKEETKTDGDARRDEWKSESSIRRTANGIPYRVDRLRGLGNAVVPQIPEILGRLIVAVSSNQPTPAAEAR